MGTVSRYFAGASTAEGFVSHFGDILPEKKRTSFFYIKGGPGVGKSSLMKAVGAAMEEKGLDVEYFFCSSDPDSLDGVSSPETGVAFIDGTAPHGYDPIIPGGRDILISLGDFLNEKALRAVSDTLILLNDEIGALYSRAFSLIKAAGAVKDGMAFSFAAPEKMLDIAAEISAILPIGGDKRGSYRHLFGSALTYKGIEKSLPASMGCISLKGSDETLLSDVLSQIAENSAKRGNNVVVLHNFLRPHLISSIVTGKLEIGANFDCPERQFNMDEVAGIKPFDYGREENFIRRLLYAAEEIMGRAKKKHDLLEQYYITSMDFAALNEKRDSILSKLGLKQ